MRKACIWMPSMLSGNTETQGLLSTVSQTVVCVYIDTFIDIIPFPVSSWIRLCLSLGMSKALEPRCLGVQTKLQNRSKAMPVSSCVITKLVLIYSRKMCVLLLLGSVCTNTFFCGCFAQLKQVIKFSSSGYTDGWRYLCCAKQVGRGNFWFFP